MEKELRENKPTGKLKKAYETIDRMEKQTADLIEINNAQSQLLASMGETNKQLAKRLVAIQDVLNNNQDTEKALQNCCDIYSILNP